MMASSRAVSDWAFYEEINLGSAIKRAADGYSELRGFTGGIFQTDLLVRKELPGFISRSDL
jgi:hypothetical protein